LGFSWDLGFGIWGFEPVRQPNARKATIHPTDPQQRSSGPRLIFLVLRGQTLVNLPAVIGNGPVQSNGNSPAGGHATSSQITQLLAKWSDGDQSALEELTPLVYDELRRIAHHYMAGARPDHTLQTTALVNEAYLRLADQTHPNWQDRAHFFAVAARAMRQILVNYAMGYNAQKRGGGARKINLDDAALVADAQSKEVVELNEALERLSQLDARKAQVVELKYFGGLNQAEIADVLKISPVTVRREWRFAKAWLHNELYRAA
jgi:RNA polymerase sigma-70 factor, ECF subfamily